MVISGGTSNPITGPTVQDYPSTSSSNGGNIISGLVGGIGSIFDFIQGYQNLQLQQDMLNYQKQMQRTAWKREDNAIYRRTLDMRMAGLSPTLAAGNGAQSSAPIKLSTPQSNIPNPVTSALEVASAIKGIEHQQASISRTEAETRNIDLQSNKTAKETAIMEETHPYKLRQMELQNMYDEETLNNRIGIIEQRLKRETHDAVKADYEAQIKKLGITEAEIDIQKKILEKELLNRKISKASLEMMAMEYAIRYKKLQVEKQEYNNWWYSSKGYPIDGSLNLFSSTGAMTDLLRRGLGKDKDAPMP